MDPSAICSVTSVNDNWMEDEEDSIEWTRPKTSARVRLTGEDGNYFNLIGLAKRALVVCGADDETIAAFNDDMGAAKTYEEAMAVVMDWMEID